MGTWKMRTWKPGTWKRWGWAVMETAAVTAAFLAIGLGYGALGRRAPAEPTGYVAERAAAPEELPAHVAAWNGRRGPVRPAVPSAVAGAAGRAVP